MGYFFRATKELVTRAETRKVKKNAIFRRIPFDRSVVVPAIVLSSMTILCFICRIYISLPRSKYLNVSGNLDMQNRSSLGELNTPDSNRSYHSTKSGARSR